MKKLIIDTETGEEYVVRMTEEEVIEQGKSSIINESGFTRFVYQVDFWSRMTDEEAQAVKHEMESQPFRLRRIFESAGSYREDHELWPLLSGLASALFGEDRAKEILAPSE